MNSVVWILGAAGLTLVTLAIVLSGMSTGKAQAYVNRPHDDSTVTIRLGDCMADNARGDLYNTSNWYCEAGEGGGETVSGKVSKDDAYKPTEDSDDSDSTSTDDSETNPVIIPAPELPVVPDTDDTGTAKNNNGHGNNTDKCDSSNPSGKCPAKGTDTSAPVDDEKTRCFVLIAAVGTAPTLP